MIPAGTEFDIWSPTVPKRREGWCLSFWYHMYGEDIGQLVIYSETSHVRTPLTLIDGAQGDAWREMSVTLDGREDASVCHITW